VHGGKWAVRIERSPDTPQQFSGITKGLPVDFAGKTIELRGFVRTENVSESASLWLREDGESGPVAFDSVMMKRKIQGTTDWTEYSASVPVQAEARQLFFGFFVAGTGKGWVDDIQLLVDGKPIWEAPHIERPKSVLDSDREFDAGSRAISHGGCSGAW
jgi:hypothetical protein